MAEILIVDTDKRSINEVADIVKNSDYSYLRIFTSSNVQRSMTLLKQSPPNALIIDASLPDIDGITFGKTALQLYPGLPIIITTQLKMFEVAQSAINAGFVAYLLKPLSRDDLLETFDRVLKPSLKKEVNQTDTDSYNGFDSDLRKPIQSAVHYIQLHYNEQLTLKGVADRVYLSPSYFSKLFKDEMEMTFVEYLSWIRIQKSKNMLRMSSLPIDVIANNTGFANSSYFATTFKKVEGKTPSQYRDQFLWEQSSVKIK